MGNDKELSAVRIAIGSTTPVWMVSATFGGTAADVAAAGEWLRNPIRVGFADSAKGDSMQQRSEIHTLQKNTKTVTEGCKSESDSISAERGISADVQQIVHLCAEHKKVRKLIRFLSENRLKRTGTGSATRTIVFCNKIKTAKFVADTLRRNRPESVALLVSALPQHQR
eukprot:SAG31_NODE_23355_length_506_cov_0.756757_1_plen_168_part_11